MDVTKDLVVLFTRFPSLTTPQKVFVGVQSTIGVFVAIFLIILVFFPETYGLNDAGVWMSRIALGGLLVSVAMNKLGGDFAKSIGYIKASS